MAKRNNNQSRPVVADMLLAVFLSIGFVISLERGDLESLSWEQDTFVHSVLRLIVNLQSSLPTDGIVPGLVGMSCFLLLRWAGSRFINRSDRVWLSFFSSAVAFLHILACSFRLSNSAVFLTGNSYLFIKSVWRITSYSTILYCLLKTLICYLDSHYVLCSSSDEGRQFRRRSFFILWGFYLLILLFFFPGIVGGDAQTQIAQYYGYFHTNYIYQLSPWYGVRDFNLVNSHPFLTTYLFGVFIELGNRLGGASIGIFLYDFLHSAVTAAVFSSAISRFRQDGLDRRYLRMAAAFYVLFIPMQFWAITMVKDTLYGLLHILLIMQLLQFVHSEGELIKRGGIFWKTTFLGIAYSIVRSQGLIIMVLTCTAHAVVFRKQWKRFALMVLLIILICQIGINSMLAEALNVAPGGKQETLGFFFQQTARYVASGYDVTEQEAEVLRNILDYDRLPELYNPTIQDPVKVTFNAKATWAEMREYFSVWWRQFLRHPGVYFAATFDIIRGYFRLCEFSTYVYRRIDEYKIAGPEVEYHYSTNRIASSGRTLYVQAVELIQELPIINVFISRASFLWLTVLCLILLRRFGGKKYLLAFLPTILLLAGLVFCPVAGWRYFIPEIMSFPILALTVLTVKAKRDEVQAGVLTGHGNK